MSAPKKEGTTAESVPKRLARIKKAYLARYELSDEEESELLSDSALENK
jgi:hypothetical protein